MNQSSDKVSRYLASDEDTEMTLEGLQKLADETPYFSIAHFLLAKRLKAESNSGFIEQAQKTALYFPNTLWLHYQLNEPPEENDVLEQEIQNIENSAAKETLAHDFIHIENDKGTLISSDVITTIAAETSGSETKQFIDKTHITEKSFVSQKSENDITNKTSLAAESAEVLEEMAGVNNDENKTTAAFLNEIQPPAPKNTIWDLPKTTITPADSDATDKNNENGSPDEHEKMFQNIKAMLDAANDEANADIENTAVPIDPYYTIDYFASQGIKLALEQNPKDQLGQNLKKFTQWLKHMKKLGPENATAAIVRTETEADIQKIADSSNTVREVVTEAMASVLEKQGKKDKAIELYSKLSFLNPHKSAYFAGKIKNLKVI